MRSYEFTGKNVTKAIEEGLRAINKTQEEVDIKILAEGGLFKKAKVLITIDDEPTFTFEKPVNTETKEEKAETVAEETIIKEAVVEPDNAKDEINVKDSSDEITQKEDNALETEEKFESVKVVSPVPHIETVIAEERHASNNVGTKAFLTKLLAVLNIDAEIELTETRENSVVKINTESAGKLIGKHGEGLNALQFICNIVEQKENVTAKRVVIDVAGYKEKREESLRALAIRVAGKVEATKRPYRFDAMNAYERRIIHTELQNYSSVETHSEGTEPNRRLVVTLANKNK